MMPVATLLFSVVILASPLTITQSKDINSGDIKHGGTLPVTITGSEITNSGDIEHGGTLPVTITGSEITNSGDDANIVIQTTLRNGSLTENKNELPPGVDIVSDNRVQGDNQHVDVNSVNGQNDLDGNSSLEGGATEQEIQQRTSEEENTFIEEELQQDPPDVRSDTGQFPPGIMENSIRLEENPSSSSGIKVGSPSEEEAVECPPPVRLVSPALCGAPACLSHRHCRDPDTACCFNGCVHTCLTPLDAPAVIDWLEDTSLILPMLDEAPGVPRYPMLFEGSSSIAYAQGGGEAVHLQGGCTITSQQYNQLKDYMTKTNIQDCSCTGGEVVCVVKPYKREEE